MAFTTDAGTAAEKLLRNHISRAPSAKSKRPLKALPDLPEVELPDLDDLYVEVPIDTIAPPSQEDVATELDRLALAHGHFERIDASRTLERGHEVLLDLAVYDGDRPIPGTIRTDVELDLDGPVLFPELAKKLVGHRVGDECFIDVALSGDGPDPRFRGKRVRFSVRIKAARSVTPADLRDPSVLSDIEPGLSFEALVSRVEENLIEERTVALRQLTVDRVLSALVAEIEPVEVPTEYVEEQIRRIWMGTEGQAMAALGFSFSDQQASLSTYFEDPALRAEAEHRLKVHIAFLALMKKEGITIDEVAFDAALVDMANAQGVEFSELKSGVPEHRAEALALVDGLLFERCLEHVLSRATVVYVDGNGPIQ